MTDDSPTLVRNYTSGRFGLFYPEEPRVETYDGDEEVTITGEDAEVFWHDAHESELREEIEGDIQEVQNDIDRLREEDLSDEQAEQLNRIESRLDSYRNLMQIVRGVQDGDD